MRIVLFTHPTFLSSQSMPRYASMLKNGMEDRGHEVVVWTPRSRFYRLPFKNALKKWLGYIDQYLFFPLEVKLKLRNCSKDTLFVFADQALGLWVPLVKNRKHVIHCHDFLAQQSAFGLLPESKTGLIGVYYQKFIRWGYRKGLNFICISKKTQSDLHLVLSKPPKRSQVVYNGLYQNFEPVNNKMVLREGLSNRYGIDLSKGYILHVGGNTFYKNKLGVLEIYDQWAKDFEAYVPLILVGELPTKEMIFFKEKSKASKLIYFITDVDDMQLQQFYQGASVMLFPSLYEGFGWPIVEAMASGCLVITTNENPMKEVAGDAGFYISKKSFNLEELVKWKKIAAQELEKVMQLNPEQSEAAMQKSIIRSKEFSVQGFVDSIEDIYLKIIDNK